MPLWIYDLTEPVFGFLCCGVFFVLGILGYFLTRPVMNFLMGPPSGHRAGTDAVIGAVALLYGLLLAQIAIGAWQQFVAAQNTVAQEAATLRTIYRDVDSYPEPARTTLTGQLRDYTKSVIEVEWPMQQAGIRPAAGQDELDAFEKSLYSFEPEAIHDQLVAASAITEFNAMMKLRATRLNTVDAGIPGTLWTTLFLGAVITTVSTYFLQFPRVRAQLAMTSFVTLLVAAVVFMTAVVDHPFRGTRGMSVTSQAFQVVYHLNMAR